MGKPMEIINKKGVTDRAYIAGLHGKQVGLYASSLAAAMQKAVEYFKPKKKDRGLLWVELASEE